MSRQKIKAPLVLFQLSSTAPGPPGSHEVIYPSEKHEKRLTETGLQAINGTCSSGRNLKEIAARGGLAADTKKLFKFFLAKMYGYDEVVEKLLLRARFSRSRVVMRRWWMTHARAVNPLPPRHSQHMGWLGAC